MKLLFFTACTIGLIITMSTCNFSSTYIDDEADKQEGKKIVDSIYYYISTNNFFMLNDLASDTLSRVIGSEGLQAISEGIVTKMGNLKEFKIVSSNSQRIEGSQQVIYYKYNVIVQYEKGEVKEVIGLKKEDQKIKIISYNAYANMLGQ